MERDLTLDQRRERKQFIGKVDSITNRKIEKSASRKFKHSRPSDIDSQNTESDASNSSEKSR